MLQRGAIGAALLVSNGCSLQDFETLKSGPDLSSSDVNEPGLADVGQLNTSGATGASDDSDSSQAASDAGASENLIEDPGFESGNAGWLGFGQAAVVTQTGEGRDGSRCLACIGRTQDFEGPAYRVLPLVSSGERYRVEGWVRVGDSASDTQTVHLSLKTVCPVEGTLYGKLDTVDARPTSWTLLSGELTAAECGPSEYQIYFEGPGRGVTLYVDDVGLYRLPTDPQL